MTKNTHSYMHRHTHMHTHTHARTRTCMHTHTHTHKKKHVSPLTPPSPCRGALHRKLNDFNAAIDDFLLALDKCDHNEESPVYSSAQRQLLLTYNDFAVECFTKGFYDEAIILLNKAIKGEKNEKGLYINRGGKTDIILITTVAPPSTYPALLSPHPPLPAPN